MSSYVQYLAWAILVAAAVQDLVSLRISNVFPLLLLALFPAWVFTTDPDLDVWRNVAMMALALAIGIPLFAAKWLGGGDVKLMAAAALWFDLYDAHRFFFWISIGGAMLALLFVILRRMLPRFVTGQTTLSTLKARGPIPYGLAIAGGAIWCSLVTGFHPQPPITSPFQLPMPASWEARR